MIVAPFSSPSSVSMSTFVPVCHGGCMNSLNSQSSSTPSINRTRRSAWLPSDAGPNMRMISLASSVSISAMLPAGHLSASASAFSTANLAASASSAASRAASASSAAIRSASASSAAKRTASASSAAKRTASASSAASRAASASSAASRAASASPAASRAASASSAASRAASASSAASRAASASSAANRAASASSAAKRTASASSAAICSASASSSASSSAFCAAAAAAAAAASSSSSFNCWAASTSSSAFWSAAAPLDSDSGCDAGSASVVIMVDSSVHAIHFAASPPLSLKSTCAFLPALRIMVPRIELSVVANTERPFFAVFEVTAAARYSGPSSKGSPSPTAFGPTSARSSSTPRGWSVSSCG